MLANLDLDGIKRPIFTFRASNLDKRKAKMRLSQALLLAVASADDKKVPPRHPLQRLERLTEFSAELLNDWYEFLPS